MRHVFFRGIAGLVWLAVAVVNGMAGNLPTAAFFLLIGALFLYSAYSTWKKEKQEQEEK